ncbi:hypothetical protein [Vreelandella gomseomensis]|uniref:Uncharacterized protein n=1 Tax=Vreelandella gomseomensis TaxID=370766 RepID=A0ABU1GDG7_9GAMM|nr:hypothetical protein [Halomonas gomseomensis]MDR5875526.1 hypothetical protein [Halomonas gomseomensis]
MNDAETPGLESRLITTGVERLALLGRHAEALMQGYANDQVPLEGLSHTALRKLLSARIVWRPDEQGGLKLTPKVRELIAEMVSDEARRHVNADVAEALELIRSLIQSYRDSSSRGDYWQQEQQLLRLRQAVDDMNGRFADAIDSLWQRLNSDFGFVSQLNDKVRENDRAQKQVVRLLDGLALIDFDELIELVGSDGTLRKVLISQLQQQISQHYTSLREVQHRLIELMARFRHMQARSRLVAGMAAFLREHPGFTPGNYARRSEVPALFNHAAPLTAAGAVALDRAQDMPTLSALLENVPTPLRAAQSVTAARPAEHVEDTLIAARQQALKDDVETFYLNVVDRAEQTPISALDYLNQSELQWPPEIWLFQVIAEHQGLPHSEQRAFHLHQQEERASAYNDVKLIRDVSLGLAV